MAEHKDEFDAYDLSEFTEEDLARFDAETAAQIAPSPSKLPSCGTGGPAIVIEVEPPTDPGGVLIKAPALNHTTSAESAAKVQPASPFEQFRRFRNALSVTDLVAPAWCEVQFDYGLRQKRHKGLKARPATFVTSAGKEILVKQEVAARNERVLKIGTSVHKRLEQEIRPEAIQVDITTEEERWAIRLIDMLACLRDLMMNMAVAREMPVFGIVHGITVAGVIDEVSRKPFKTNTFPDPNYDPELHEDLSSRRPQSDPLQNAQTSLASYSSVDCSGKVQGPSTTGPSLSPHPARRYTLHISDTKTRRVSNLPSDEDALSSRLQLMLYRLLLSKLISQSPPFHFQEFWKHVGVDPKRTFSGRFIAQAGLMSTSDDPLVTIEAHVCLNDLTREWSHTLEALNVEGVEGELVLVYRLQQHKKRGSQKAHIGSGIPDLHLTQEERDIARAVEESLLGTDGFVSLDTGFSLEDNHEDGFNGGPPAFVDGQTPNLHAQKRHNSMDSGQESTDDEVSSQENGSRGSLRLSGTERYTGSERPSPTFEGDATVIGTKSFKFDGLFLDEHITDMLQYWHGRRSPRGVELANIRRCFSCEYFDGCEWREMKAKEASKPNQRKMS